MASLFIPVSILVLAGLVTLSSVAPQFFVLQVVWVAIGVVFVIVFRFIDWRFILNYKWLIVGLYAISVFLLVAVYFFGPSVRGVRSWLVMGPFNFQPVELAKVALILVYAAYFSKRHLTVARLRNVLTSFVFFAVPAILVIAQPDFGSAFILFGIWFSFLALSGLPSRRLLILISAIAVLGVVSWFYFLEDYHKARIIGVFYPERGALGINYSAAQSKIAIGSAGIWGKGYGQGTQAQLGFLTESPSDFIFAALTEEWGMLGAILAIAAFLWLVVQILIIGKNAERNFEKFVCLGAASVFGLQFVLNVGSALGVLPVVGLTFPFLSYGGSSLVAMFFLISLVYAVSRKR